MVERAGCSERRSSPCARPLVAAICILALLVVAGAGDLTSTSQARTPKPRDASPHTSLPPAAATGAFGLDLMRTEPPGNLVLSPDSIAAALAMAGSGARGRTAAEIADTLRLARPAAFGAVGRLQSTIAEEQASAAQGDPKAPTLAMANGLFLQQGFPIEAGFLSALQTHFGAAPEAVDFVGDLPGSVKTINEWASDHTNGIIPQLLASLPQKTRLALANAVYLKASWLHPFKPRDTSRAPFYNHAGSRSVEFMHETERLRYGSGRGYAAVDLPYRASTLSLLVVLPAGKSVGPLQHRLSARGLARVVHGLSPRNVELSLPRFRLSTQTRLDSTLEALGMGTAFSGAADFSRITRAVALKIGLVEHAADLKVDEAGTEAAAATVVGIEVVSAPAPPRNPVVFNANHPFLLFLRDDRTGAVLFAGRVTNPASPGA